LKTNKNVLVVAPDTQLRRSITFLLEAEGYEVTAYDRVPASDMAPKPRRSCAIVDEAALADGEDIWDRLGRIAETLVMLVSSGVMPPTTFLVRPVEKPLLGQSLVEAVGKAIDALSDRST
jgi:FixJ family two-component response regulator